MIRDAGLKADMLFSRAHVSNGTSGLAWKADMLFCRAHAHNQTLVSH